MNNAQHDHSKATPSTEADKLEKEVDLIYSNVVIAMDELSKRMKNNIGKIDAFFKNRWLLFAMLLFIYILLNAMCKKKR